MYFFFFFFSSRRRHTRSLRDWSSDVCSSDLREITGEKRNVRPDAQRQLGELRLRQWFLCQSIEDAQYRCGVRTPAAEPTSDWNSLLDYDLEAVRPPGLLRVQGSCAVSEIFLRRLIAHDPAA